MIIGRGLLAKGLIEINEEKYLLYANCISNSVLESIPRNNFEINAIEGITKQDDGKMFIYCSTS